jgi:hypothetical protein
MNMPGFTAEAALYVTNGYYRRVSNYSAEGGGKVLPQRDRIINRSCNLFGCCVVFSKDINGFEMPLIACRSNGILV